MMRTLEFRGTDHGHDTSVAMISGHEPTIEHRSLAKRVLAVGGNGLGLIGANPATVDAGSTPTCIPGPGVDTLVARLADALQIALALDDHSDGHFWETPVRENVTFLFSDIVGWTQMAIEFGPERADDVRRRHFSTLHLAIAASGGTEVKRLGDGVMVVFSTASAALACAVAMQRDVDKENRLAEHPVGLRIGLSGGEVTREGGDYFGEPVIEAARLCACASSGTVLLTRVVKEVAGRRAQYPFRAMGQLDLKGFPEPLETFEVVWDSTRPSRSAFKHPIYATSNAEVIHKCGIEDQSQLATARS
jgi:class 3 adenylate cyclase